MPTPPGFNNHVRKVDANQTAINDELASKNLDQYWATDIKFIEDSAYLLFVKNQLALFGETFNQKVNVVSQSQAALDADKTTEQASGYWPTGIFPAPDGTLFILYQQLDSPPPP